jgi:hypothetical protein
MLSTFIPGLEDLVDEAAPAPTQPETISTVDAELEKAEDVQAASELGAMDAEGERITNTTNVVSDKIDEMERMVAHIQKYGVDRSFLSLCNHDNILNRAFNLQLPSCESFDVVGNPNSIASQEALEGLKNGIHNAIEWIKKMWKKFVDWFMKKMKAIKDFFYGKRREKQTQAAKQAIDALQKTEQEHSEATADTGTNDDIAAATASIDQAEQQVQEAGERVKENTKALTDTVNEILAKTEQENCSQEEVNAAKQNIEKKTEDADAGIKVYKTVMQQYDAIIDKIVQEGGYAQASSLSGGLMSALNSLNRVDDPKRFDVIVEILTDQLRSLDDFTKRLTKIANRNNANPFGVELLKSAVTDCQKTYTVLLDSLTSVCRITDEQRTMIIKRAEALRKERENADKK